MAEPYLSELRSIVEQANLRCKTPGGILCRHFFSGAAAYVDGHIFMTLTTVGLALKLPEDDRSTLFDQGAKSLQYFPQAPIKKDYAVLPSRLLDDHSRLSDWISRSIDFVLG
ncbi:MAG: TfoX/Sxy family protein [Proteobacteria bacterium]|nr:TfoX/Sxy family protein [Pseudomonadota bacterium]